jgi:hypothetical protein
MKGHRKSGQYRRRNEFYRILTPSKIPPFFQQLLGVKQISLPSENLDGSAQYARTYLIVNLVVNKIGAR